MEQIDIAGWGRQDFVKFYSQVWDVPVLPIGEDKRPTVREWNSYKVNPPTLDKYDQWFVKQSAWGLTIILHHNLFSVDFDTPQGYELLKHHFPPGSCIAKTPHGYHAVMRSTTIAPETIKGNNKQWLGCLERLDSSLVVMKEDGTKQGKIDLLGNNSLLHSPDSPGYTWLELYAAPVNVPFEEWMKETFGYATAMRRLTDYVKPGVIDKARWVNVFCPWCEFDGLPHDSASCSVDLGGGGYKCHGTCGRDGKLTEFVEHAKQVGYPLSDEIMRAYQRFKERGDKLPQYTSDSQYGPPQTLKQLLDSAVIGPQLIVGVISRGEIVMAYGTSGVGKSSFFENLMVHACAGLNFADIFLVMKSLRGLYVAMEMSPIEVGVRFETLFKNLGKGEENFRVQTFTDFDITKPEAQRWLYDTVKQGGYELIVLDPFEDMHHLEENKSTEMGIAIAPLRRVVNELNCGILLVHHAGADAYDRAGRVLPKRPRGSTAIEDRMDTIFELLNTENEYEKLLHVRKQRRALIPRQKDITLKYDPETLLMSLGGPPFVTKAYKEGAAERYRILGALLKVKALGVTDEEIAKQLGVDRSTVTRYMSGIRKPPAEMQAKFPALLKWAEGRGN